MSALYCIVRVYVRCVYVNVYGYGIQILETNGVLLEI